MRTSWNTDKTARVMMFISVVIGGLIELFTLKPSVQFAIDFFQNDALGSFIGFLVLILSPMLVILSCYAVLCPVTVLIENRVFAKNRRLKETAEFIIEARGKK